VCDKMVQGVFHYMRAADTHYQVWNHVTRARGNCTASNIALLVNGYILYYSFTCTCLVVLLIHHLPHFHICHTSIIYYNTIGGKKHVIQKKTCNYSTHLHLAPVSPPWLRASTRKERISWIGIDRVSPALCHQRSFAARDLSQRGPIATACILACDLHNNTSSDIELRCEK
jgi:hypothetical protein